jgi:uncharacterized protein YbcC (UPF0753/DUF2309 family)
VKPMEIELTDNTEYDVLVERACLRVAPLWPLKHFVAVSPYFGLRDMPFWQAGSKLAGTLGSPLTMDRRFYRDRIASGRISQLDIELAISELRSALTVKDVLSSSAEAGSGAREPLPLFSDYVAQNTDRDWSMVIRERVSHYCASYFDEGQANWTAPWRYNQSLYSGWLEFMKLDKTSKIMGLKQIDDLISALPSDASKAVDWALSALQVPENLLDDYLFGAIMSVGGWASWARYTRWQAELKGDSDTSLAELLAVRLSWEAILLAAYKDSDLPTRWQSALASRVVSESISVENDIDVVLQRAFEIGYERSLVDLLESQGAEVAMESRPDAQVAFCIDVRSEIIRRSLETVAPKVQTLGFAGFFGVQMEYVPLGSDVPKRHLPVIFNPPYRVWEGLSHSNEREIEREIVKRRLRLSLFRAWKNFKTSAVSTFTFVETIGLAYIPKLFGDSMGWTRTVAHPDKKGLSFEAKHKLRPLLTAASSSDSFIQKSGIPRHDLASVGEFILKNMGLTSNFSRIIVLAGHGSTTVNNPQATGLDCGACAGQTGEASARIAAALLNDPTTRKGLEEKGISIPKDSFFVPALHDTTTDEFTLFDTDDLPSTHADDLKRLRSWLEAAGDLTRLERSSLLGTASLPVHKIRGDIKRRTRNWAEVRPEWALAKNASFIAAPRERTRHLSLEGRSFLHDYDWRSDIEFSTLELIMTAPMVVANWINMQYYGSMVDNPHFGSGNKVLHNVVGGSIGVLEGNGGDLRVGLAIQSLHDGKDWVHEPVRLNVVIEAPSMEIDKVIAKHQLVRELIDNQWIHLYRIGEDGSVYRRISEGNWLRPFYMQ